MTNETQTERKDNWKGLNQILAECTTFLEANPLSLGICYDGKTGRLTPLTDYSDLLNLRGQTK
jgi:hypothetical protein